MMRLDKTLTVLRINNMNPIVDGIMIFLFVIFMIFIFGGYHKNKSAQREEGFRKDEEKENNTLEVDK